MEASKFQEPDTVSACFVEDFDQNPRCKTMYADFVNAPERKNSNVSWPMSLYETHFKEHNDNLACFTIFLSYQHNYSNRFTYNVKV